MYSIVRKWTPRSSLASSDRDDVRVIQPGGDLDLATEPLHSVAVAAERRRQDLQRDYLARRRCRALKTTPIPPCPSLSRTR